MAFFGKLLLKGEKLAQWQNPQAKIPVDAKDAIHGKYICKDDKMIDFMVKDQENYESAYGRFYREKDYDEKTHSIGTKVASDIVPSSIHKYIAIYRPGIDYCKKRMRTNIVYSLNRTREAEKIKKLREEKYKIDLVEYQERLSKPETNKQAIEELHIFTSIIKDAHSMDDAALAKKYEKVMMVSKVAGFAGMVFGAAAGGLGVAALASKASNMATNQSTKLANAISDKVGKVSNLAQKFPIGFNAKSLAIGTKASAAVAGKVAGLIILGAAANLTIPGATLTVLAVVSTVIKAGANIAGEQIKKNKMALEMNSETLVEEINKMIKNNGTIFYREDNPMFKNSKVIKDELDTILNTVENNSVINALNQFVGNTKVKASQQLNSMMNNAANETPVEIVNRRTNQKILQTPDELFETELEKLKVFEKANNSTLKKLRNRRSKLKRLHTLYKKNTTRKNNANKI